MAANGTLDRIPPGGKVRVVGFSGDGELRKRIAELGLTKGAVVEVERVAPLGDPMDIRVRGYHLSLRKEEASGVVVEEAGHA